MIRNIITILLLLVFIGVVVFLDVPKVQEILDLRREVETQQEKLSQKQLLLAKAEELRKKYEENEENLKKVNYILPSGEDVPNLIVQFEALALEAGVALEGIKIYQVEEEVQSRAAAARAAQETAQKDYQTLSANLTLKGSYSSFKNLIELIERNIRLIDITAINISVESIEETETPIFNFDIDLKTYYQ